MERFVMGADHEQWTERVIKPPFKHFFLYFRNWDELVEVKEYRRYRQMGGTVSMIGFK